MFSRLGLRPLMVCCALFAFSHLASAQAKIAVINLQRAVFESAEIKKADAEMQARFKPRQEAIDKLQGDIANAYWPAPDLQAQTQSQTQLQ